MNANEVDVEDEVVIVRGDWAGQRGKVQNKCDLFPDGTSPPKALLTIRLAGPFQKVVQKNNFDVEKTVS